MKTNKFIAQLNNAYERLKEAVAIDLTNPLAVDGTIQRFEFCFELSWKCIKSYLEEEGILCNSPRRCLKEAFRFGLIENEEPWLSLLKARNLTAHVYNEKFAKDIYDEVCRNYTEIGSLLQRLSDE